MAAASCRSSVSFGGVTLAETVSPHIMTALETASCAWQGSVMLDLAMPGACVVYNICISALTLKCTPQSNLCS